MKNFALVKKRHAHMVGDANRNLPLLNAIGRTVKKDDIVLDIGTGLGMLAIAAAKAGAKHVYAIECDANALEAAKKESAKARMSEKISFIQALSFDVKLPQRVDLIICETVGSFAFDENILATISDAKKRFLNKDGKIIPAKLGLWGAPLKRLPKFEAPADIAQVNKADLLGAPIKIVIVDFHKQIPKLIHSICKFRCNSSGTIKSIALWPKVMWRKNEVTDASPLLSATHWKQGILEIEPKKVIAGDKVSLELIIAPHPDDPLMMTERLWRWA